MKKMELRNSLSPRFKEIKDSIRSFISRSQEDERFSANGGKLKEFHIPDYILVPVGSGEFLEDNNHKDNKHDNNAYDDNDHDLDHDYTPSCPVIVFINSKSGGQLGGELLVTYRTLLNKNQVIDLTEKTPDKVLQQIYATLQTLKNEGDELATEIEKRLRIIVAGGDGTAGWLLGVICDLKLPRPPPIATVPLGTGNNLPFSFGWGKKNPGTDRSSVESFLEQVRTAREMKIDSWHIIMRMKCPKEGPCEPVAPLELPHSLHAFRRVSKSDSLNMEGYHTFRGGFWNYFSMGMDAQISYAFHSERKLHPERFKNQLANQGTYFKLGCTQGWFCASLCHPSSRNIAQLTKVKIMKSKGQWEDLKIPSSIRSIVCLNLPSFSGGLDPWGRPNGRKLHDGDLKHPFVDDGLIELVGFRNGWHGLVLFAPNGHGTRLAQANKIRFEFRRGAADHTYMRIDGEPWKQPLPVDDDTVVVEISNHGQVTMLATPLRRSKSVHDRATPTAFDHDSEDHDSEEDDTDEEDESADDWEERRKFGASDTFKFPDDFDISRLS